MKSIFLFCFLLTTMQNLTSSSNTQPTINPLDVELDECDQITVSHPYLLDECDQIKISHPFLTEHTESYASITTSYIVNGKASIRVRSNINLNHAYLKLIVKHYAGKAAFNKHYGKTDFKIFGNIEAPKNSYKVTSFFQEFTPHNKTLDVKKLTSQEDTPFCPFEIEEIISDIEEYLKPNELPNQSNQNLSLKKFSHACKTASVVFTLITIPPPSTKNLTL